MAPTAHLAPAPGSEERFCSSVKAWGSTADVGGEVQVRRDMACLSNPLYISISITITISIFVVIINN